LSKQTYKQNKQTQQTLDIDVLVTDVSGRSTSGVLNLFISKLHSVGLLTDDLNNSWRKPDEMLYMGFVVFRFLFVCFIYVFIYLFIHFKFIN
jgi:hypothetical protein